MNKTIKSNEKNSRVYDLMVNITIAIICGIIAAVLFVGYARSGSGSDLYSVIIIGSIGFISGASYGLWHAYVGWKKSENKVLNVEDIKNIL